MATIPVSAPNFTMDGANLYPIGDASDCPQACGWLLQFVNDGATFSATVEARNQNSAALADDIAYVTTLYRPFWLNGAIGDGALVSTAITADSLVLVPAPGMQIQINVSALTSGTVAVYLTPVLGPTQF